ncbi:MAG: hypothetical protein ACQGVC_25360 [Myxococcota bacterium]
MSDRGWRAAFLVCSCALGVACTSVRPLDTPARPLAPGTVPVLAPDEGILVVFVETDIPLTELEVSQASALADVPKGKSLHLLAVSEGTHRWSGIVISAGEGDVYFKPDYGDFWEFRVEAGRTNYPGELIFRGVIGKRIVRLAPVGFRNRSAGMFRRLRESHRDLLERYPLIYTGQKSDEYLDFLREDVLEAGAEGAGG